MQHVPQALLLKMALNFDFKFTESDDKAICLGWIDYSYVRMVNVGQFSSWIVTHYGLDYTKCIFNNMDVQNFRQMKLQIALNQWPFAH